MLAETFQTPCSRTELLRRERFEIQITEVPHDPIAVDICWFATLAVKGGSATERKYRDPEVFDCHGNILTHFTRSVNRMQFPILGVTQLANWVDARGVPSGKSGGDDRNSDHGAHSADLRQHLGRGDVPRGAVPVQTPVAAVEGDGGAEPVGSARRLHG